MPAGRGRKTPVLPAVFRAFGRSRVSALRRKSCQRRGVVASEPFIVAKVDDQTVTRRGRQLPTSSRHARTGRQDSLASANSVAACAIFAGPPGRGQFAQQ